MHKRKDDQRRSLSMWTSAVLQTNKHTITTSGEVSGVSIILRLPLHTHSLCVVRLNAGRVSDSSASVCLSVRCMTDFTVLVSEGVTRVLLHML